MEYSKKGKAPYVLGIHGTPGTHDGLTGMMDHYLDKGFGIISPSRPGYSRTPLLSGRTPAEAADCFAALLDVLEVDKVVVFGASGGGPSALQFAARHPNRIHALLLECAVTGSFNHKDYPLGCWDRTLFTSRTLTRFAIWML